MTTLQINIDEATAEAIRQHAQQAGKTPEAWASEIVTQHLTFTGNKDWIKKYLEDAEKVRGNSGGVKWTRDELYDR